ncbi:MAG TPA: hypothetical protein VM715_03335, partial [Candidatus Acidoferrum sp.]|nr:hypothetical protein [Candidatus Acidoferrum sp.]
RFSQTGNRSNSTQPRLDDLVGQLEIFEPLPECRELFFLATLQLLSRFLITAPPGIAIRKKLRQHMRARARDAGGIFCR